MSELRDAIAAAIYSKPFLHMLSGAEVRLVTDAVLAVLDEHTTEEWNVSELEDEVDVPYRTLYRELPMGRNLAEKIAAADPTAQVVSRRVTAWEPVEGDNDEG